MSADQHSSSGRFSRDPVSHLFDTGSSRLLTRAYARFGEWTVTYLAPPTDRQRRYAAEHGVDIDGPDDAGSEPNRWVRAFKRSCYRQLRLHGFAADYRPGQIRMDTSGYAVAMQWDSSPGLRSRPTWNEPRWLIRIRLSSKDEARRALNEHPERRYAP